MHLAPKGCVALRIYKINMQHLVFVYGTLKKEFPNHRRYMKSARLIGKYQTLEKYPLVLFGDRYVPGMLNSPGEGHHVEGELYEMNDECLARIDFLEGTHEPDGYRRQLIAVNSVDHVEPDRVRAHVYLLDPRRITDRRSAHLRLYEKADAARYKSRTKV